MADYLTSITLTKNGPNTGLFRIHTTGNRKSMLVSLTGLGQLSSLVAVARRDCIGQKVINLSVSETYETFELRLESGFLIKTL